MRKIAMVLVLSILIVLAGCANNDKNKLVQWFHELDAHQTEISLWSMLDDHPEIETALTADEEQTLISILHELTREDITWNKHFAGITPLYGFHLIVGDDDYHINQADAPRGQTEISFKGKLWWIESTELYEYMNSFLDASAEEQSSD